MKKLFVATALTLALAACGPNGAVDQNDASSAANLTSPPDGEDAALLEAPDDLLATALEIQETSKITALIVVENQRPIGLVHYLDLLRAGVA